MTPSPYDPAKQMRRISRRSFVWAGLYVAGLYGALRWINSRPEVDGVGAPFRKGLGFSESVWRKAFSPDRLVPTYDASQVTEERVNGDDGLSDDYDVDTWRLRVEGVHGHNKPVVVTMDEIKKMPATTMTTELFCIEGWSIVQTWKGVLMREFMAHYPPQTLSGTAPDLLNGREDLVPYVYMETPDTGSSDSDDETQQPYYVGLDMPSVIHAQTMLCYEINGKPLAPERGAPLRLVIPVKYGVKNIKRIGLIRYTNERPRDYWAEQGYDWYCGL